MVLETAIERVSRKKQAWRDFNSAWSDVWKLLLMIPVLHEIV
jgi:hypothetical protein